MKWHIRALIAWFSLTGAATAQDVGQITPVTLSGGSASQVLDFSERDYELIFFSTITNDPDASRSFSYTVSTAGAGKPLALGAAGPAAPSDRNRLDAHLRQKERELAARLRQAGGWTPPRRKAALPLQTTRTFTFEKYGNVTSDKTVQATLIYQNSYALAYVDNALPASADNISTADIQTMLDRFSNQSYPIVVQTFGAPSDVDGNGKVIFLFTHLVDQVGDVAGFYASGSLFSTSRGGDGNQADMMYISPTRPLDFYESLLAHEFQHLVNFNQHVLAHKGDAEEAWLNEALSHYTEDLVDGHLTGGNPDVIQDFLETPGNFSLVSNASPLYGGNRGVAYLFLRGLLDEFGATVPAGLVQTSRTGIANVEAVTGGSFSTRLQTFAARLFLTGNGLNSSPSHNYAYKYLTEPATGHRSIPLPTEGLISPAGPSVTGSVKQAAVAFVRLTGSAASQRVDIQTEAAGAFGALLIPLPKGFLPRQALPVDYFPGITLNAPLPAVFTTGENVVLSGAVQNTDISQFILSFEPRSGQGAEIKFQFSVQAGQFTQNIIFDATQTGDYTMALYAGKEGELLPAVGKFPGTIVAEGTASVVLPVTYFPGITLSAPFPTRYAAGTGASFAGQVTNTALEVLLVVFIPQGGGDEIRVQTGVSNGAFRKGFVFTPAQAGTYELDIYGGQSGGSLPHIGGFSPITIASTGSERVYLPVDFFNDILLDAPLAATYFSGKAETLSGRVTDTAIEVVLAVLTAKSTGQETRVQADVSGGTFQKAFSLSQVGDYTLDLYGGPKGGSLPHRGTFSSVTVLSSRPVALLRQTALAWGEITAGERKSQLFTLLNTGSEDLQVTGITPDSDRFSVSATSFTVSAGDSASVIVTFAPSDTGTVVGTLQIATNDPDAQALQITLSATVVAPASAAPSADFNGDGQVGFTDFLMFAAAFGAQQGQPGYSATYDLNSDDSIGFTDFLIFAAAFGKPAGG